MNLLCDAPSENESATGLLQSLPKSDASFLLLVGRNCIFPARSTHGLQAAHSRPSDSTASALSCRNQRACTKHNEAPVSFGAYHGTAGAGHNSCVVIVPFW